MVRRNAHLAAQRIQLPDQMALPGAANGRIAGHIAYGIQVDSENNSFEPQPRRGQASLDPRVARANDSDLIASGKIGHSCSPCMILSYIILNFPAVGNR